MTNWPWHKEQITAAVMVIVPAMICAGVALWALWRRIWRVEIWVLLAHVQLFVVMLNAFTYGYLFDVQRITIGVVLAAIYCLPLFDHLLSQNRLWFCACAALWLVPTAHWLVITW